MGSSRLWLGLIIHWSKVRVLPGPPFFTHHINHLEIIVSLCLLVVISVGAKVELVLTSYHVQAHCLTSTVGNRYSGSTHHGGIIRRCCFRREGLTGQYESFLVLNTYDGFYGGSL